MLRTLIVAVAAGTATAVGAAPARAQATGCEDAAVRLTAATLPRVGAPQWNDWVTLTGCGTRGASVIASALRSDGVRTETELTRLDHLTGLLDGWFQPQLITAYEWLLRAPDASHAVRLRAMWLLAGLYAPDHDVAGPLQGFMSTRCEAYERKTSLRDAPETLPAEAYDRARDAIAFVADDRYAPEYVRSTARCWEGLITDALEHGDRVQESRQVTTVSTSPTTVVVQRPVRVVYDCDSRFVFYNDAGYDLAVRYAGFGTSGVLRVGHGGPFVWAAVRFGPVRFWVGDVEVFYTDAVYRPCHSYGHRLVVGAPIYPWYGWHAGLGVYLAPRVVLRPRIVVPAGYVARPPRYTRPIIVVPRPRGGRDGYDQGRRDWNRGNDDRDRRGYGYYDRPGDGGRGSTVGVGGPTVPRGGNDSRPIVARPRDDGPRGGGAPPPRGNDDRDRRGYGYYDRPGTRLPTVDGGPVLNGGGRPSESKPAPRAPDQGPRVAQPRGGDDRGARPDAGARGRPGHAGAARPRAGDRRR
jgi:hypothetical protein